MLDSMIVISSPEQRLRTRLVPTKHFSPSPSAGSIAFEKQYRAKPKGDPRADSWKIEKEKDSSPQE